MVLNNKQKYLIILLLLLILIFSVSASYFYTTKNSRNGYTKNTDYSLQINDNKIKIEVAATASQQYLGLSKRKSLCTNCGMLFIFPNKENQTFVMRNMEFPLDIIFIDDDTIIDIASNLSPEGETPKREYRSSAPVNRVLELPGDYSRQNNIKVGDKIIITKN